jgi:rSAM/selenodomain-associated transferase 1
MPMPRNNLGILVRTPIVGAVGTGLMPALSPEAACDLYRAFLGDLFERLGPIKAAVTVFYDGDGPADLPAFLPKPWPLVPQVSGDPGVRMNAALRHLLSGPGSRAVVIGSGSPDLPLGYLKRAFQKLKHSDVVLGPAMNGGCYLIGVSSPAPGLFEGIEWGSNRVLAQTVDLAAHERRSVSLVAPWYVVDDASSFELLQSFCLARRLAGGVRLPRTERFLSRVIG